LTKYTHKYRYDICLTACGPGLESREETDDLGFRKVYSVDAEGRRQGVFREYDAEGQLLVEETYTNDTLNGPRLVYNAGGRLVQKENIVMGRYTGEHLTYDDETGALAMRGVYTDGAMNDKWYTFYPDGSVRAEMTFRDNLQHGPVRQWYADGTPEFYADYHMGKDYKGAFVRFDSTGALERVLNCEIERGCMTFWTPDSTSAFPVAEVDMEQPEGM